MGLAFSNLFNRLWDNVEQDWVVVGLNNAGKSTMLQNLKLGDIHSSTPISGLNLETFEYKRITFRAWDLPQSDQVRNHCKQYLKNAKAIIFVVDSNDHGRLDEARDEIQRITNDSDLHDIILCVYANKQDLPDALGAADITQKLCLHGLHNIHWFIQASCATSGDGLFEGLEWTANTVRKTLHA